MPLQADAGRLLTVPGGHPVVVLSEYPSQPDDLVILVNLTHVDNIEGAELLFKAGYRLSAGFTTTKDSTIFPQIRKCTRSQADALIGQCQDRGFIGLSDLEAMRSYAARLVGQISEKSVRDEIIRLAW